VVVVRFTLSDVFRSHCLFIVVSSEPVVLVTLTTCGAWPSKDTA